ncbi:MAG: hypothetical protein GXP41_01450 [Chloroflexi bacterium]|nr:hypothetical protein [Chloroflexota bacterium]
MKDPKEAEIRIVQEESHGPLQIDMGTSRHSTPDTLDEDARERLREIQGLLHDWLAPPPTPPAPPDESVPPATSDAPPSRPPVHLGRGQVATPALAEEFTEPFWRRLLDAILLRDERLPARPSLDSEIAEASGTFIAEMEEILRSRLANHPNPPQENIRFITGVGGRLQILVGEELYDGIADIPDSEIRDLLKETIAEWEERH